MPIKAKAKAIKSHDQGNVRYSSVLRYLPITEANTAVKHRRRRHIVEHSRARRDIIVLEGLEELKGVLLRLPYLSALEIVKSCLPAEYKGED